jgi:hypothetical protein
MLLHDACDVVMEAAKICNYCQQEELATAFFAVFVVAWVVLRLAAFPLIVIRSTLLEYPRLVPVRAGRHHALGFPPSVSPRRLVACAARPSAWSPQARPDIPRPPLPALLQDPPHYLVFNGALLVLLLLHCYWFSLIVRILVRKLSNQQLSDVREEDGDD